MPQQKINQNFANSTTARCQNRQNHQNSSNLSQTTLFIFNFLSKRDFAHFGPFYKTTKCCHAATLRRDTSVKLTKNTDKSRLKLSNNTSIYKSCNVHPLTLTRLLSGHPLVITLSRRNAKTMERADTTDNNQLVESK